MTKDTELQRETERLINTVARLMGGQKERMLLTVSQGEFGALMFLADHEDGVTSGAIGRAMRIGPGGVANLLKTLERKGLIVKKQSSQDRRANSVSITEEGLRRLEARREEVRRHVADCLQAVGLQEAAAFNDTLEKILAVSVKREHPGKTN